MRALLMGILLAVSSAAMADEYDLYDGLTGVACEYYNRGGWIPWKRKGGDWKDANGVMYGDSPVAVIDVKRAEVDVDVSVDVTSIARGDGILLRGVAPRGITRFYSRESEYPPALVVTRENGDVETIVTSADSTVLFNGTNCSQSQSVGKAGYLYTYGYVVMAFPHVPSDMVRAELKLRIMKTDLQGKVGVFAMVSPAQSADVQATTGFAAAYPGDKGIETHPDVLYFESWDNDPDNWWRRSGDEVRNMPSSWNTDGGRFPDKWMGDKLAVGEGVIGNALKSEWDPFKVTSGAPTYNHTKKTGEELDEMYIRYYIKFQDFRDAPVACDGGKVFGISGDMSECASSGNRGDGYCGWSARLTYVLNCDKNNPIYPKLGLTAYVYHAQQLGDYGDVWPTVAGGRHGLLALDEWHCVEERVKMNTPGVADGVVQVWVNGKLGVDKQDVMFRRALTPERPRYDVPGNLGIQQFWGTFFHGGHRQMGRPARTWVDQTVVARSRIGCIAPAVVEADVLRAEIARLVAQLDAAKAALADAQGAVDASGARIAAAAAELSAAQSAEQESVADLTAKQAAVASLSAQIDAARARLAEIEVAQ